MEENHVQTTQTTEQVGDTTVHREHMIAGSTPDPTEYTLSKSNQVIWFLINLIAIIVTLRFVFMLFGANRTGIALFIYQLSDIFVTPFKGIFPSAEASGSFFDSAAILAIVMWYLFGFILTKVLVLFSPKTEA